MSQLIKKLVIFLITFITTIKASEKANLPLKHIVCIHHLVQFKKN